MFLFYFLLTWLLFSTPSLAARDPIVSDTFKCQNGLSDYLGFYCDENGDAYPCPSGYYCSPEAYSQPVVCPPGHYCPPNNSHPMCETASPKCASQAIICPDGTYSTGLAQQCSKCNRTPCDSTTGNYVSGHCQKTTDVTKCARLPVGDYLWNEDETEEYYITSCTTAADSSWSHFRNGIFISGTAKIQWNFTICTITSPFNLSFSVPPGGLGQNVDVGSSRCCLPMIYNMPLSENATALPGDLCPNGFFTVVYEEDCGVGMVDTESIPDCENDTTGEYCLISTPKILQLCDSGITVLKTSTGLSFSLYAEAHTTPALNIEYNDKICYGNLAQGQASNSINIKYNNTVYHLTD